MVLTPDWANRSARSRARTAAFGYRGRYAAGSTLAARTVVVAVCNDRVEGLSPTAAAAEGVIRSPNRRRPARAVTRRQDMPARAAAWRPPLPPPRPSVVIPIPSSSGDRGAMARRSGDRRVGGTRAVIAFLRAGHNIPQLGQLHSRS